ncbi:MAG: PAS domain S-box protein [Desulfamplus sp.]|nr:PAS domain S-box protein [Desulfamplus sp.]
MLKSKRGTKMSFPYATGTLKKTQYSQEELDTLCSTMFNTTPAGIIITKIQDGQILAINDSMLKILGLSREMCTGTSILDMGFYTNKDTRNEIVELLIKKKSIHNTEFPFLTSSGSLHYGIFSAQIIQFQNQACIFTSMFDITCKMDAQSSLENTAGRLEALFQSIPDMVFVIDYSGKILHTNRSASQRLGYTEESLKNMHVLNIHPSDRRTDVVAVMGQMLSEERTQCDIPLLTSTGQEIPVETKVVLSSWNDKNVIIGLSRDITERVAMEQKHQELQRQLQHAQKMEAIGVLAGGIAHDFNNILFPITAYSELLQEALSDSQHKLSDPQFDQTRDLQNQNSPLDTSSLTEYVDRIHSAAIRAKELVKQVLTFSKEVNQEIQPLQPSLIVKEVIKLIRKTIPKSIRIEYKINPECNMIMADSTQFYQIAMNLIVNAFHAMESSGGTLTVKLDNVTRHDNTDNDNDDIKTHKSGKLDRDSSNGIKTSCMAQEEAFDSKHVNYIHLSVSDTGIGMDELTLRKIFNPYFTTKSKDKGTGLGLSVVHGIVRLYNGEIRVKSVPGEGTTFDVFMPAIQNQDPQGLSARENATPKGDETILFVDDEDIIIRPLARMLNMLGYQVKPFISSTEALAAFAKNPYSFDLVITDLSMPDMSGVQLSTEIFKIRPLMPVILCTGFSYNLTPEKAKEIGIKAMLMKPIVKSDLTNTIRQVLNGAA